MKLCIDPGHGMSNRTPGVFDPGAVATYPVAHSQVQLKECEADLALQIGLTLKWICDQFGMPWWMTRMDDRSHSPLGKRDERARIMGCSHFLSLHLNAGGGTGTETYYRDARDRTFADIVHSCAVEAWNLADRGVKHESRSAARRLSVMDFTGPCALLEVGFIDSERDLIRVKDRDCRIRFARLLMEKLVRQ